MSEMSEPAVPPMVRQGELISEISSLLPADVDGDWVALVFSPRMVSMYSEEDLVVRRADSSEDGALSPDEVLDLLKELRAVMYRPEAGSWLSAEWVIENDGSSWTSEVEFNYNDEPTWYSPIDPGLYGLDLEKFPRRYDLIPGWLKTRLAEARARVR